MLTIFCSNYPLFREVQSLPACPWSWSSMATAAHNRRNTIQWHLFCFRLKMKRKHNNYSNASHCLFEDYFDKFTNNILLLLLLLLLLSSSFLLVVVVLYYTVDRRAGGIAKDDWLNRWRRHFTCTPSVALRNGLGRIQWCPSTRPEVGCPHLVERCYYYCIDVLSVVVVVCDRSVLWQSC